MEKTLAAAPAQSDQQPADEQTKDPLLLELVLQEEPPVALIKDDEPFDETSGTGLVDRFGTAEIAQRLAKVVQRVEPPYTISLSGAWGVGKTWVAKRLKSELRATVPVVEVDLWTEDIEQLRRSLAVEVAAHLAGGSSSSVDNQRKEKADELDRELRRPDVEATPPHLDFAGLRTWSALKTGLIALGFAALLILGLAQPAPVPSTGPNLVATTLVGLGTAGLVWLLVQSGLVLSVSTPTSTLPPVREAVGLRRAFERLVTSPGSSQKVLVVLDNLDRLTGEDAVRILGEIRSFVELPKSRAMFLVPLDRAALERHLVRSMGGDAQGARDYLDKFFNLDLVLTNPVPADLRDAVLGLLVSLFPDVGPRQLSNVAELVAEAAGGSPRAAKRIANGIYARSYLLPVEARAQVTLLEVAFVESLLSRFPQVIPQFGNQDLERSMRRIAEIRRLGESDERTLQLLGLMGEPSAVPDDAQELAAWRTNNKRRVRALEDFLRVTRDVAPSPNVVRMILTVRPDRQLGRLPDPPAADSALRAGDTAALREVLESVPTDDRHASLAALLDKVRVSLADRWPTGSRNGLNALGPLLVDDPEHAGTLRLLAADYLAQAKTDDFRSLEPATIEFLFPRGGSRLPNLPKIAELAADSLASQPASRLPVVNAVRFVGYTAGSLSQKKIEETKVALAKLTDSDLEPLYQRGANRKLFAGPICDLYVARLTGMDASSELAPLELAAQRLTFAQEHAEWDGSAALDPVYDKVNSLLSSGSLKEDALPLLERLVTLATPLPPHSQLDTFAQRLAAFATGGMQALTLALTVPTTPGFIEPHITTQLNTITGGNEWIAFVTAQRALLEERGVAVASLATARWAAGKGKEYLNVALTADETPQIDAVFAALKGVADATIYLGLLPSLADRLVALGSASGAERLIADIVARMSSLTHPLMGQTAPVAANVQSLTDPAPLVASVGANLGGVARLEIPAATAVARKFVEVGVKGANDLPRVVAQHSAAEGTIDLDNVSWLLDQPDVAGDYVILGLRGAIKTEPEAKIRAALAQMPKTRRARWDIGKALVERAAAEPVGSRLPWLEDALESRTPSRKNNTTEHDEYGDALDRAVEGDKATDEAVTQLRERLG